MLSDHWSKWIGTKEPVFRKLDKGLINLINIKPIALILFPLLRLFCNILSPIFTSLGLVLALEYYIEIY